MSALIVSDEARAAFDAAAHASVLRAKPGRGAWCVPCRHSAVVRGNPSKAMLAQLAAFVAEHAAHGDLRLSAGGAT